VKLAGFLEVFTVDRIHGWAWDPERPDEAVDLEIVDGDTVLLTFRADRFRADLVQDGLGNGHHMFELLDLHHVFPQSRRGITVRRAFDGRKLLGCPASLIPTAGPHLLMVQGTSTWFVAFGRGRYRLARDSDLEWLATMLPVGIAQPTDDELSECGTVGLLEDEAGMMLSLRADDGTPELRIPVPEPDRSTPMLRWCRGAPSSASWTATEMSLEVENAIGIEFVTYLGDRVEKEPKRLEVHVPGMQPREFMLNRGQRTTVSFRVPQASRQRITMTTGREPDSTQDLGFLLLGLDVLGVPLAEAITDAGQ
jgi:hypothetical protein